MVSMVLPTAIMVIPSITIRFAQQDAWISVVLATGLVCLIALVIAALSQKFEGMTLFEYSGQIIGALPSKLLGLLYLWWLLHTNAIIIDEFAAFLCIAIMPDTPFMAFFLLGVTIAAFAVWQGVEVLARFNQILLPPIMAILIATFLLLTGEMKPCRLLPVLDASTFDLIRAAAAPTSWMGEIVCLSMFAPCITPPGAVRTVALRSTTTVGTFVLLSVLVNLLVLGPGPSSRFIFSTYNTLRVVSIANFLERVESAIVGMWVLSGFVKIGVFYYAAVVGSAKWLGLRDYRPLVAPVGVVLIGLAMLCRNIVDLLDFLTRVWPPYALVFEAVIPLVLLVIAALTNKKGVNSFGQETGTAGAGSSGG